jgi:hypothetical protein
MSEKEKNGESNQKKFDLKERLIDYAVRIIHVSEQLPETKPVNIFLLKFSEAEHHLLPIAERNKVLDLSMIIFTSLDN